MATATATPTYDILHVTRPGRTLCGLPADKYRTLKLGVQSCEECLRLMEAELAARYAK